MEHVQMLQLVACILLLNFAQIEMMFMVSLVLRSLRHQFLGHQATLLMIEHRRRRRRRARRHNPYSWKPVLVLDPPQWPNNSQGVYQKETANGSLYHRNSDKCFATRCNTRKHKIAWLQCPRKSTRTLFLSSGARELSISKLEDRLF